MRPGRAVPAISMPSGANVAARRHSRSSRARSGSSRGRPVAARMSSLWIHSSNVRAANASSSVTLRPRAHRSGGVAAATSASSVHAAASSATASAVGRSRKRRTVGHDRPQWSPSVPGGTAKWPAPNSVRATQRCWATRWATSSCTVTSIDVTASQSAGARSASRSASSIHWRPYASAGATGSTCRRLERAGRRPSAPSRTLRRVRPSTSGTGRVIASSVRARRPAWPGRDGCATWRCPRGCPTPRRPP